MLHDLEGTVSSLASLAGSRDVGRIAHFAEALDALIKDLNKKPSQMTSSVLRHDRARGGLLERAVSRFEQARVEIPQSLLILAVDDEPISRRIISVALGKANLR